MSFRCWDPEGAEEGDRCPRCGVNLALFGFRGMGLYATWHRAHCSVDSTTQAAHRTEPSAQESEQRCSMDSATEAVHGMESSVQESERTPTRVTRFATCESERNSLVSAADAVTPGEDLHGSDAAAGLTLGKPLKTVMDSATPSGRCTRVTVAGDSSAVVESFAALDGWSGAGSLYRVSDQSDGCYVVDSDVEGRECRRDRIATTPRSDRVTTTPRSMEATKTTDTVAVSFSDLGKWSRSRRREGGLSSSSTEAYTSRASVDSMIVNSYA